MGLFYNIKPVIHLITDVLSNPATKISIIIFKEKPEKCFYEGYNNFK